MAFLITRAFINKALFNHNIKARASPLLLKYFYKNKIVTMNVESLKSELQQVLDNDVVLRKEFNELKRSLSDYRNQLIMRDEDCKRLQVTIDVLNTKLVVMERDNTNYK